MIKRINEICVYPSFTFSNFEDRISVNSAKSNLQITVLCTDNIQNCLVNS